MLGGRGGVKLWQKSCFDMFFFQRLNGKSNFLTVERETSNIKWLDNVDGDDVHLLCAIMQ